jgi:hypothetical protein
MFVTDEKISIQIFWCQFGNGNIKVETSLDGVPEDKKKRFTPLTVELKPLPWHAYNELQRKCTKNLGPGIGEELDWIKFKEEKLQAVLVDWNAKDKDGKKITVSREMLFKLHPKVAEAILTEYDKITLLGSDD